MQSDYWQRQTIDKPLFPDLLWSRPENKLQAGKLLIIGGNSQGFAAAAEGYNYAERAGIGTARVLLPDALQKTVGRVLEAGEYAPSTPSGSFGRKALADFIDMSLWADGVLLAGDLGRNSETAILLESYMDKFDGQLTLTRDAITYFSEAPTMLLSRPKTVLVLSMSQLQKLGVSSRFLMPFTLSMDLLKLISNLNEFTKRFATTIVTKHLNNLVIASGGRVSTTKLVTDIPIWRLQIASKAAVWWLQNPTQQFEALTTSLVELNP